MDKRPHHRRRLAVSMVIVPLLLASGAWSALAAQDPFSSSRSRMVSQVRELGVRQTEVLNAMEVVPRHLFVPEEAREKAYEDQSVPIGAGEFMSRPYLSARMIELLELEGGEKVLEIGTGSGYDAALLSRIAKTVYTVELVDELGARASENLEALGYDNVRVRVGDGYQGWPEEAPFDAIILTAAPEQAPDALLDQLRVSGKMVIPVGRFLQDLKVLTKTEDGIESRNISPVHLAPMRNGTPSGRPPSSQ